MGKSAPSLVTFVLLSNFAENVCLLCRDRQRLEHLSRLNEVIVPVEDDLAVLIKKLMKIISNFTSKIKRKMLGCLDFAVLGVCPNHVSIFVKPSPTSV